MPVNSYNRLVVMISHYDSIVSGDQTDPICGRFPALR